MVGIRISDCFLGVSDVFGYPLKIDFGLARARHAVKQRRRIAALVGGGAQRVGGGELAEREFRFAEIRIGRPRHRFRRQHHGFQRALVDQSVDHAGADAGFARGVAFAARHAVGKHRQHARPRRRHACWLRPYKAHADTFARRPEMVAHAQRHAQHHAARRQRVVGDPIDEFTQLGFERRHVDLADHIFHAVVQARIGIGVLGPDHASGFAARAKWHAHQIAGCEFEPGRHPVGIGLIQRHRHQNVDNARAHDG